MWICGKGEESLKHILKKCEATKDDHKEISIEEFFSEKGNGLNIMRKTDTRREEDGEGGQSHREPRKPKVQGTRTRYKER